MATRDGGSPFPSLGNLAPGHSQLGFGQVGTAAVGVVQPPLRENDVIAGPALPTAGSA